MHSNEDMAQLNAADVRRRFDSAAATFDGADFVHAATRRGLATRLEPMTITPQTILDLGCATGSGAALLAKQYRRAHVVGVDLSQRMLDRASRKRGWFSRTSLVRGNAYALPFASASIDLVHANLLLPWISDHERLFREVSRVLRPAGLFVFSTLGPDSLQELRAAWGTADTYAHVNRFLDMHIIGDALVREGLSDPVLDVDRLEINYEDSAALFRDLTSAGARNSLANRNRSLVSRRRFDTVRSALDAMKQGGRITLALELVYGHCWGTAARRRDGVVAIDVSSIGRRRR